MVEETLMRGLPVHWISACTRYRITLAAECLREVLVISRQHLPREMGASVYGTYSRDGFNATILGNGPVAADSIGGRFSFLRGTKGAMNFFSDIFKQTRGKQHYVGEWHSHPGGPITPSALDNRTLRAIADDRTTNCPECILLLVGGDIANHPKLGVYVYSQERGRVDLHPDARRKT